MATRQKESSILVGRTVDTSIPPSIPLSSPHSYPQPAGIPPPIPANYVTYPTAVPAPTTWSFDSGTVFRPAEYFAQTEFQTPEPKKKSLLEAYMLALPLGWLGAHHFYLGRPGFGVLYFFTFGLLGVGYVVDLVRLPCLVSDANRRSRERVSRLSQLHQQHQQQQSQSQGQTETVFMVFEPRNLADAYVLWFPCGLFGFHHFYLRNFGMGILYLFTFGLLGIGWIVDAFRMPSLVKNANEAGTRRFLSEKDQCTAHILALVPFTGLLGGHHFYLNRPVWGVLYLCTLGLLGAGWVWDWCRVGILVRRANAVLRGETSSSKKYLDEAYVLCFPFGFTGLHHFYLNRLGWGFLYFFTFGLLGVGWVIDWFRLPCLVKECNEKTEQTRKRLINSRMTGGHYQNNGFGLYHEAYVGQGAAGGVTVVVPSTNTNQHPQPHNGAGAVAAGYGGYPGYQSGYPAGMSYSGPYPSYVMGAPQYTVANTQMHVPSGGTAPYPPPSYESSLQPGEEGPQAKDVQKRPLE